ncbi:MAG: SpoIID/LytB domain-containing protein [Prochlorotrichaceae cyanobacterium]
MRVWAPWMSRLTIASILSLTQVFLPLKGQAQSGTAQPLNPVIEVGVVQRFGQDAKDRLVLKASSGDRLRLEFPDNDGVKTLESTQVVLEVPRFPQPMALEERVVLSKHRSFESAEASGAAWQAQGIPVELAQPDTWEVWAKRSVYASPFLRRLLLENLKAQGHDEVYLASQVQTEKNQAAWVVNGYRYHRDTLKLSSQTGVIWVDQVPYPGSLHLQPNSYGSYTLVNSVTIEDYLRGVVPYEIGPQAPPAAIEAQAILARTYALRNLRRFTIDNYELCADTQCQVYRGWLEPIARADQGIRNTRGIVLTHANTLVDAVYSSTTGGITAAFEDVWEGESRPYLQPVVDALPGRWDLQQNPLSEEANFRLFIQQTQGFNEVGWRHFRWQNSSTLATLKTDLKAYLTKRKHPQANFDKILELKVEKRARGGRVQELVVTTDRGAIVLDKDQIIQALSAPNSLLFYLEPMRDAGQVLTGYTFIGGGLGHGVGLSQTGSYHLADLGWSSAQILGFYYPTTELKPLDASLLQ